MSGEGLNPATFGSRLPWHQLHCACGLSPPPWRFLQFVWEGVYYSFTIRGTLRANPPDVFFKACLGGVAVGLPFALTDSEGQDSSSEHPTSRCWENKQAFTITKDLSQLVDMNYVVLNPQPYTLKAYKPYTPNPELAWSILNSEWRALDPKPHNPKPINPSTLNPKPLNPKP